ncbi:HupE/UreJ family protein [Janthinobacterium sp. HLX7-2]|uniref:HupE/UreJ family protein n=1 Tax=Janthinobacterium sp. HLX7-2 TaxID=1259331 RepID=UPI003F28FDAB
MLGAPAIAHPSPSTEVLLQVQSGAISAQVTLPVDELKLAFPTPLVDATGTRAQLNDAQLSAYLVAHIRPVAPNGQAWSLKVAAIHWELGRTPQDVLASVLMQPPVGASLSTLTLGIDLIAHAVPNHITLVAMRDRGGSADAKPHMLDTLHYGHRSVVISCAEPPWWQTFADLFQLGMAHIAEGTDHLLFLLTLLLPAALRPEGRRWGGFAGTRHLVSRLLTVVTAFTIGHSLTLLLGATGLVIPPAQPVEVAIALSILVSAVHAWRPLFAGYEGWIAGAFGLIHGMAFATVIRDLQLEGARLAASILAFNLGIETVQALLVLLVAPLLVVLARTRWYQPARQLLAASAAIMAVVWMVERVSGVVSSGMT